jgi:hypothetical protein
MIADRPIWTYPVEDRRDSAAAVLIVTDEWQS